jgi:hypothetical protein
MTSGTTGTELVYRHQIRPVVQTASMWFSVIVPRWQGRKASLAAQLDLLNFQTPSGPKEEVRVVVTNHGPALMQKIEVQLFDNDGESLTIAETDITALWPKMPVERLQVGQSLFLTLNDSPGTRTATGALIRWRDNRTGEQEQWASLSYHRVF